MKLTKLLLFPVFVLLAHSCSVQYSVYSAKVVDLSSEIVTLPTVTELHVSDTLMAADTLIERHLFKNPLGYRTKKDITDALIASVLKESGSDVLVEPKITTETTQTGFWASTLRIGIEGFPAKYSGFRTITMEDIQVLNALKKEKKTATVKMADFLKTDAGKTLRKTENALTVTDPIKYKHKRAKTEKVRRRRSAGLK